MNYTVITNETLLREFIEWLPELQVNEKYYVCLFARNKYVRDLGLTKLPDKAQLKRFTSDKPKLLNKIKQLEVPLNSYSNNGIDVPQEALALYITVNPRDLYNASLDTISALSKSIKDKSNHMNPHQEALSAIHKSKGKIHYLDFDIDESNEDELKHLVERVKTYVNKDAITWLKTRGGLHALVDHNKVKEEYKKSYYRSISIISQVDQTGDLLIPVPGTYQGGFTPHFVNY